ncbi:MerR family transcriptional regulator [Secundilactobacillus kimchicus]
MTYAIGDVAEKFNLSISTIRYYDKRGLLPFVSKNKSGHRAFTDSDLKMLYTVCCLKDTG